MKSLEKDTTKESITIILIFIFSVLGILLDNTTGGIIIVALLTVLSIVLGRWTAGGFGAFLCLTTFFHPLLVMDPEYKPISELIILTMGGIIIAILFYFLKKVR